MAKGSKTERRWKEAPPRTLVVDARLAQALALIDRDFDKQGIARDCAATVDWSPVRLRERFQSALGEPLGRYVRRMRLERGAAALKLTGHRVLDIALACGFDSHEGFTRAFRRAYGQSPVQYRGRGRVAVFGPAECGAGNLPVRLIHRPPLRVACCSFSGPASLQWVAWSRLLDGARAGGFARRDALYLGIRRLHQLAGSRSNLRYDACITVDERFRGGGEIGVQELQGAWEAVMTYSGMPAGLTETWVRFAKDWVPRSHVTWEDSRLFEVYRPPGRERWDACRVTDFFLRGVEAELHIPLEPSSE